MYADIDTEIYSYINNAFEYFAYKNPKLCT